jgi:NodT family efflux transporter outer membrane factor (OMF) lipoprotein
MRLFLPAFFLMWSFWWACLGMPSLVWAQSKGFHPFKVEALSPTAGLKWSQDAEDNYWKALGIENESPLNEASLQALRQSTFQWVTPELQHLLKVALIQNPSMAIAQEHLKQAQLMKKIQFAKQLPSVNLEPSVARQKYSNHQFIFGNNFNGLPAFTTYNAPVVARYELDLWGVNRDATKVAQHMVESQLLQMESLKEQLIAELCTQYIYLLETREQQYWQAKRLDLMTRDLLRQQQWVDAGLADAQSLHRKASYVQQAQNDLNYLKSKGLALTNILNALQGNAPTFAEPLSLQSSLMHLKPSVQVDAGTPSELVQSRPDLQAAERFLRQKELEMSIAKRMILPRINLMGSAGFTSVKLKNWFDWESLAYNLAASAVQPIFQGGSIKAGWQLKQSERQEALRQYHALVIGAFLDVENALVYLNESTEAEAQHAITLTHLREEVALEREKVTVGFQEESDILSSEINTLNAEIEAVQRRRQHLIDEVSLLKALGCGRYLL